MSAFVVEDQERQREMNKNDRWKVPKMTLGDVQSIRAALPNINYPGEQSHWWPGSHQPWSYRTMFSLQSSSTSASGSWVLGACPCRKVDAQNLPQCFGIGLMRKKLEAFETGMVQYKKWSLTPS